MPVQVFLNGVEANPLTNHLLKDVRVPFANSKSSNKQAHAKGDLHGNAVNFLHALMTKGVVKFNGAPNTQELQLCGITGSLNPNDYYEFFKRMYQRPLAQWNNQNLQALLTSLASEIEVSDHNQFIDMGDDFFDRGKSDVFTMILFQAVAKKNGITAMISNHAHGLIWIMERYQKELKKLGQSPTPAQKKQAFLAAFPPFDQENYTEKMQNQGFPIGAHDGFPLVFRDCPSGLSLHTLVQNNALSLEFIEEFYNRSFVPKTQLIHSVKTQNTFGLETLQIFAHAPISELDILRAAYACLLNEKTSPLTESDKNKIMEVLAHAQDPKIKLKNDDLVALIEIINRLVRYHGENHSLNDFVNTPLRPNAELNSLFGDLYEENGEFYPFLFLFQNRNNPNDYLKRSKLQSDCEVIFNHGHVGEGVDYARCNNLDSSLAKRGIDSEGRFVVESFQLIPEKPGLTQVVGKLYRDNQITQHILTGQFAFILSQSQLTPENFTADDLAKAIFTLDANNADKQLRDKITAALFRAEEACRVYRAFSKPQSIENFMKSMEKLKTLLDNNFSGVDRTIQRFDSRLIQLKIELEAAKKKEMNDLNSKNKNEEVEALLTPQMASSSASSDKTKNTLIKGIETYLPGGAFHQQATEDYAKTQSPFHETLGGGTSDHAYRVIALKHSGGFSLRGGTYNMLEKAKPLPKNFGSLTNNPVGVRDETASDYQARKMAQLLTLVELLHNDGDPLDFLCLQEADWAFSNQSEAKGLKDAKSVVNRAMTDALRAMGYAMIVIPPSKNQQALVTIYNQASLTPEKLNNQDYERVIETDSVYRAAKMHFTDKNQNQICVINGHLRYGRDNSAAIEKALKNNGRLTVFAGDANANLSQKMPHLWISDSAPSVISAETEAEDNDINKRKYKRVDNDPKKPTLRTLRDLSTDKSSSPASYDGFAVFSDKLTGLEAQISGEEIIEKGAAKGFYRFERMATPGKVQRLINPVAGPAAGVKLGHAAQTSTKPSILRAAVDVHKELRNNIGVMVGLINNMALRERAILDLAKAQPGDLLMIGTKNYVKANAEMIEAAKNAAVTDSAIKLEAIISSQIDAYKLSKKTTSRLVTLYDGMRSKLKDLSQLSDLEKEILHRHELKQWASADLPDPMKAKLGTKNHVVGLLAAAEGSSDHQITVAGTLNTLAEVTKIYDNGKVPVFASNADLLKELNAAQVTLELGGKTFVIKGVLVTDSNDPNNSMVLFKKCDNATDDPAQAPYVSHAEIAAYKVAAMAANTQPSFGVAVMMKLGAELSLKNSGVKFIDEQESAKLKAKL